MDVKLLLKGGLFMGQDKKGKSDSVNPVASVASSTPTAVAQTQTIARPQVSNTDSSVKSDDKTNNVVNQGDKASLSTEAKETASTDAVKNEVKDTSGKFTEDLNKAQNTANERKGQVSNLENDIKQAKEQGTDEKQVQGMQEKLDKLKEEQTAAEEEAQQLQERLDGLKNLGQLSSSQSEELQNQLNGINGTNGDNKAKLDELQKKLHEMNPKKDEKAQEEKQGKEAAPGEAAPGEAAAGAPGAGEAGEKKGTNSWDDILTKDATDVIKESSGGIGAGGGNGLGSLAGLGGGLGGLGGGNGLGSLAGLGGGLGGFGGGNGLGSLAGLGGGLGGFGGGNGLGSLAGLLGGNNNAQQNGSGAVQKLSNDYKKAMTSSTQLKPETEELVNTAFSMAGIDPAQLLGQQNGQQNGIGGNFANLGNLLGNKALAGIVV